MKIISMYFGWRRAMVACVALLGALPGCASAPSVDVRDGKLAIIAAFYPFQFVAERVAGPTAEVTNLTAAGGEPHDLELTPRQMVALSRADLVIVEHGFQPGVDDALAQIESDNILDTTSVVPLVSHTTLPDDNGTGPEPHVGDHDHASTESGPDPHIWLDPTNLIAVAEAVADRLAALNPSRATEFRQRAEHLAKELHTLDEAFARDLRSCERNAFVTTHAAFGYLAARYNLEQIAVSGLSPDAEPSPARIAEVQRIAVQHGVTTIFYETLISPAVARTLATDLGLRTDVLDPIEGLSQASHGEDYLAVMMANLRALQTANECQ